MEKENSAVNISQTLNGWNWGNIKLEGNQIKLISNGKEWINLPGKSISNLMIPAKNELGIEFNLDDKEKDTE